MKIERIEFINDQNGGHFEHTIIEKDFPDSEGRHDDLCVVCGDPDYPKCIEGCPVMTGYDPSTEE